MPPGEPMNFAAAAQTKVLRSTTAEHMCCYNTPPLPRGPAKLHYRKSAPSSLRLVEGCTLYQHCSWQAKDTRLRTVQLEGQVILKLVKHCQECEPALVTGQLLGLDIGQTLEVTDCFPFPVRCHCV